MTMLPFRTVCRMSVVHLLVARELEVAVHDDRQRRLAGRGLAGSNTYHASAPLPPELTRHPPCE